MDIHVNKGSDIPLHEQVAAQVVFLIGTGRLKPGSPLTSVRALAQRLGIHRNTISKAFRDVTLNRLIAKHAGRRLIVRRTDGNTIPEAGGLNELIQVAVSEARRRGYSLQQVHDRLHEYLLAAPPDHRLALSDDAGMRVLFPKELRERFACPVDVCTPGDLLSNPVRGMGALVLSPQGHIPRIQSVLSPERPAIPITYAPADEYLDAIRRLEAPSLIAVVSVSSYFLEMAGRLLAPALGRRHSMRGYLMTSGGRGGAKAADVVLCACVTYPLMRLRCKAGRVFMYKLISAPCLQQIAAAMGVQPV